MAALKNDRLIRALLKRSVDTTPIWIMRQAGRYLPEYRKVRARAKNFLTLCQTPELACEVTLQPLRRFDLDAAIIFSDILTIPAAMGLELEFHEGSGPRFAAPLRDETSIRALGPAQPEDKLTYVMDAVRMVRRELDGKVPLIGFAGSPWTLAVYMIEGRAQRNFAAVGAMLREQPRLLHLLLNQLSAAVAAHLNAQIEAGAQCVMVFDSWGGILDDGSYTDFSLRPIRRVFEQLTREKDGHTIPNILFTKSAGRWLEQTAGCGCNALGLDHAVNIGEARRRVGDRVALQGNLDPAVLRQTPHAIRTQARKVLDDFGGGNGHVFNLGHGITPDVPPDNVAHLIEAVRQFHGPRA